MKVKTTALEGLIFIRKYHPRYMHTLHAATAPAVATPSGIQIQYFHIPFNTRNLHFHKRHGTPYALCMMSS